MAKKNKPGSMFAPSPPPMKPDPHEVPLSGWIIALIGACLLLAILICIVFWFGSLPLK